MMVFRVIYSDVSFSAHLLSLLVVDFVDGLNFEEHANKEGKPANKMSEVDTVD